jgi:bacterioferritin
LKQPITKVSPQLLDLLNQAISLELQVSIQYMMQHVQWSGVKGFAVHSELRSIAMAEMKHAETIAERLYYLGGIPTVRPAPILVWSTLPAMLTQDLGDEAKTVKLYKQIIDQADKEGDKATSQVFRDILVDEEGHHDTFTTLLEAV